MCLQKISPHGGSLPVLTTPQESKDVKPNVAANHTGSVNHIYPTSSKSSYLSTPSQWMNNPHNSYPPYIPHPEFDFHAPFDYPFQHPLEHHNSTASHYLVDPHFSGYRPESYPSVNFDPNLAFNHGAKQSQFLFPSSGRYSQTQVPPTQQYPDTQLLQPTFIHPSAEQPMFPSGKAPSDAKIATSQVSVLIFPY